MSAVTSRSNVANGWVRKSHGETHRVPWDPGETTVMGNSRFAFTPSENVQLLRDIGRSDVAAIGFVEDVEACLHAFNYAASSGQGQGLPKEIACHLTAIVHAAAQLRSALYGLPNDIAMLIDLHLLFEGARRRITSDLGLLVEPLEDIAGAIIEIQRAGAGDVLMESVHLESRLVRAIAVAFRNRLNRKPTPDDNSDFPITLAHLLEFAGHRLPRLAAVRAAVSPAQLRKILG